MTLLEIILAMSILTIIAAPLLNVFVSSTRSILISREITDAEHIAQIQMEQLVNLNYADLLDEATTDYVTSFDDRYEYTVELSPSGAHDNLAGGDEVSYFHIVPYEVTQGGNTKINLIAVMPDGNVMTTTDIGTQIILNETVDGGYEFIVTSESGNNTFAQGSLDTQKLIVIVSTPRMNDFETLRFSFHPKSRIVFVLYSNTENYSISPGLNKKQIHKYAGSDQFLNFLVRATVKVYKVGQNSKPLAQITNTLYPEFSPPV
jgi:type II secretory pathway pseudopilin PulG